MDKRLEQSVEKAVFTLQAWSGSLDDYRLERRILNSGGDKYYDIRFLVQRMIQLEFVEEKGSMIVLTQKGWDFKGFDHIKYEKYLLEQSEELVKENLKLQNESLAIQNSSSDRQLELDKLAIENLKLQNRQLKRYIIYSIIAFIAGAILSNLKDIWSLVQSIYK